jgi:hypothetical protein
MLNTHTRSQTCSQHPAYFAHPNSVGASRRLALVGLAAVTLLGAPVAMTETAADTSVQEIQSNEEGPWRRGFSNASLRDRYGFHVLALSMDPANPTTGASFPFAISGYYHFNGDGTLYGKDTVSQGRSLQIIDREYLGTYQVAGDGTGTLQLFISPTFQPQGRFVITKSGAEIEIIFAVRGNLNAFTLKKQHTR